MAHEPRWFRREPVRLVLAIHAQPGARRTEVAGVHGDSLKVRVQAPAQDDRANDALIEFIATRLGIVRRDVTLASGARSREKRLQVPPDCDPLRLLDDA
ncbi:MAG: DUF167 domain-containing protein [Burkholderiales bacterium]|nr:DUF167 domain-containing protein [Burkholderiales bacterium]